MANGRLPVLPEGLQLLTLPDPPTPNPDLELPLGTCTAGFLPCFGEWATFALTGTRFRASDVVERGTASALSSAERAAYDAPFPAPIYMTGPRVFPSLLNTVSAAPTNAAARAFYDQLERPLLTLFGRLDPNLGTDAVQAEMRDRVPGARGQAHHAYDDAQHFLQEDKGKDLARRVAAFIAANPAG